jgi:ATP-binding cassette, subfamily B, bacterial
MTQSKNYTKKTLLFYWQKAWHYPYLVVPLLITVPLALLSFRFLPPLVASSVLSRISDGDYQPHDIWNSFGPQLLLYAGLTMLGGILLMRLVIILIWKLEMRVIQDIHQSSFDHLMSMSASFHSNRFGGSLVNQVNKAAGSYVRLADTFTFQLFELVLAFAFSIIILAPRAPFVVLFLVLFSIVYIAITLRIAQTLRKLTTAEAKASTKQTGFLADAITNIMAVKSFATDNRESQRYHEATAETRDRTNDLLWASIKRDLFFSSSTTSVEIAAFTLAVATALYTKADIATIFLTVSYAGIISGLLWQFSHQTIRNYNRAMGDSQEMMEILDIKPEVKDPVDPQPFKANRGGIRFRNATFTHDGSDEPLFNGLDLSIKPGEKVGLVGPSGSGKTTLARLLLRFSDIQSGSIEIDGHNITAVTQADLRQAIAYVPQEPLLFHRSIRENIAYGRPEADMREIAATAKRANAAEFIEQLPKGYDTLVGERGVKLSGGQRQRIAIARAMLKNAPILVLDEATSALDSESELLIQDALWKLMENRTAIVIAHRLSTIQKMDRIVVLVGGKIVEQGSHKQLIKQNGMYAKLWSHQSGGFIKDDA